ETVEWREADGQAGKKSRKESLSEKVEEQRRAAPAGGGMTTARKTADKRTTAGKPAARKVVAKRKELPHEELASIERVAVELASLAGAEITNALGGIMAVKYKGEKAAEQMWRDPVSEVDHRIE